MKQKQNKPTPKTDMMFALPMAIQLEVLNANAIIIYHRTAIEKATNGNAFLMPFLLAYHRRKMQVAGDVFQKLLDRLGMKEVTMVVAATKAS